MSGSYGVVMAIATVNPVTGETVKTFDALTSAQIDTHLARAVAGFAELGNDVWCIDYKGQFRLGDGTAESRVVVGHREVVRRDLGHLSRRPEARDPERRRLAAGEHEMKAWREVEDERF